MNWRIYVILAIFALFFIILILNPNLSCFGRRIRSPLYPLFRGKKKRIKTEDYGFSLLGEKEKMALRKPRLERAEKGAEAKKKALKIEDYGFSLVDDQGKRKPKEREEREEKKKD